MAAVLDGILCQPSRLWPFAGFPAESALGAGKEWPFDAEQQRVSGPETKPMEAERLFITEPIHPSLVDVKRLVKTSCLSFNLQGHQNQS